MTNKNTKFILILLLSLALCIMPLVSAATANSKSDKPTVEVFVFSYCPYAAQFEKALFPVYNILRDKVNFNIIYIGSMHGVYEEKENIRQICIKKIYGEKKFMKYLEQFATNQNMRQCREDNCRAKVVGLTLFNLHMNEDRLSNCISERGLSIYNSHLEYATQFQIFASPTLLVNGEQLIPTRSPEGIKEIICKNIKKAPKECKKMLSDEVATVGFG